MGAVLGGSAPVTDLRQSDSHLLLACSKGCTKLVVLLTFVSLDKEGWGILMSATIRLRLLVAVIVGVRRGGERQEESP
jgi:hypothetical protein